mmetsp:Transcript_10176/g.22626  ORF Transcript_10176/g.22626 Transcript_10176/m.22626 type:complete len:309 (-) Transcript_10176:518-1444(-)
MGDLFQNCKIVNNGALYCFFYRRRRRRGGGRRCGRRCAQRCGRRRCGRCCQCCGRRCGRCSCRRHCRRCLCCGRRCGQRCSRSRHCRRRRCCGRRCGRRCSRLRHCRRRHSFFFDGILFFIIGLVGLCLVFILASKQRLFRNHLILFFFIRAILINIIIILLLILILVLFLPTPFPIRSIINRWKVLFHCSSRLIVVVLCKFLPNAIQICVRISFTSHGLRIQLAFLLVPFFLPLLFLLFLSVCSHLLFCHVRCIHIWRMFLPPILVFNPIILAHFVVTDQLFNSIFSFAVPFACLSTPMVPPISSLF